MQEPLLRIRSKNDVTIGVIREQLGMVKRGVSAAHLPVSIRYSSGSDLPVCFDSPHFKKCVMVVNRLKASRNVYILVKGVYRSGVASNNVPISHNRCHVGVLSLDTDDDSVNTYTPFVEWLPTCVSDGKNTMSRFPLFLLDFDVLEDGLNKPSGGVWDMTMKRHTGLYLRVSGKHAIFKSLEFF